MKTDKYIKALEIMSELIKDDLILTKKRIEKKCLLNLEKDLKTFIGNVDVKISTLEEQQNKLKYRNLKK